jgi:3-methylfumaryl-CoA hydratase
MATERTQVASDAQDLFPEWVGRESESEDSVTDRLAASFRATFAPHLAAVQDGVAPLGLHWCLSPPVASMSELGPDGHPGRNRDLPPVPQPRRMWAGGLLESFGALLIGDRVRRKSRIGAITRKQGRSGELWFVAVHHDYTTERGLAIRERHDIVYREAAKPAAADAAAPRHATAPPRPVRRSWTVETPPTLLFRYSALSFNGHRIHYDLPYATAGEGYRGLVVHGPVQATLLLNLAASEYGAPPAIFEYRGLSPAIAGDDLLVCAGVEAEAGTFWTQGPSGQVHMEAKARG